MASWLGSYLSATSWLWSSALSAIIGATLSPAISWANWTFRVKPPFRNVFQVSHKADITCILPSIPFPASDQPEYIAHSTPFESVFFFRTFLNFAKKIGVSHHNIHVRLSDMDSSEKELDGNLFCLGGPIHNRISKALLQTVPIRDEVRFNGHDLECLRSKTVYRAEIEANKIVRDFALLMVAPNPWSPEKRVILLAGCRGHASIPIFGYISERSKINELARYRGDDGGKFLYAIFSARIQHIGYTARGAPGLAVGSRKA